MISIEDAKSLSETNGLAQVIIFGWDGARTHIATYGKTVLDSAQAATGANLIKRHWGWPENLETESLKVQKLIDRIALLEMQIAEYKV